MKEKIGYHPVLVQLTSKQLVEAAEIAEQIEALEKRLEELLQSGETKKPHIAPAPVRQANSSAARAPKAAKGERGTLRPAVVDLLKKSKNPMKAAEIYDSLLSKGYQFTFSQPKKVLGIRLYKMAGVQPLGGGLFKAK
jgi:hypothetical protein